ncbi:MAG TPA: PhzF family phenazine biosynthesis protein [Sphingomicrobium sp.]
MRFDFITLDVFTDKPFGGNQLAVLTDARGLTTEAMQMIAREFDYPETTFVLPAADPAHTRRVRIFTPGGELPFAGHPTVGTACALVMSRHCAAGDLVLEEGVGPVAVSTREDDGAFSARLRISRAPEAPETLPEPNEVAAALSLQPSDVLRLFCAGMGPRFTFAQVASKEVVDRAQLDHQQWRRFLADSWGAQLYVFAGELSDGSELYGRMFAPGLGIAEDPATGAAAAAIVGTAALADGAGRSGTFRLDIVQGVAMGRPSFLSASAELDGGAVSAIEVGGACAFIAEGTIEVPESLLEQD